MLRLRPRDVGHSPPLRLCSRLAGLLDIVHCCLDADNMISELFALLVIILSSHQLMGESSDPFRYYLNK